MNGLTTVVTCPECGGEVKPVNVGKPDAGTHTVTIVECCSCAQQWAVTATMRPHGGRRRWKAREL